MKNKAYVACLCIQTDIAIHTDDNDNCTDNLIVILSTNFCIFQAGLFLLLV